MTNPIVRLGSLLVLALCVASVAGAQEPSQPRLGPAPRITDPAQLVETRGARAHAALAPIDATNRQAVIDSYNTTYLPARAVANDWTGTTTGCVAGSTSAAYASATLDVVNYFRAMTGLPAAIPRNAVKDGKAQQAALMMTANNRLSHTPPTAWTCYTASGAEAAGSSNLALGAAGAAAIALYIQDSGASNTALGHRRWILYPRQTEMGTGSTSNANDLWVIGGFGGRPATPEFVAWPTAGFVPYALVYPRWSFSLNTATTVDFTHAAVTLTRGGVPVALTTLPSAVGYGDNTIAWEPVGLAFSNGAPDQVISVDVRNVIVGGVAKDYRYTVTVIDPAACAFTVTPQFAQATSSTHPGTVTVTASSPSCTWTAGLVSGSPWLTITSGPGGTGSGEVSYQVAQNTGSARTGTMTIAGTTVTIAQDGPQVTPYTYYLAEGATGSFFDLDIVIANPNDVDAPVAMTFLDKSGRTYPLNFTLPAKQSRTVAVEKDVAALASTDVSTIVTSSNNLPLVVERSLFWDATYYGGHTGNAVDGPQTTWYFGEGFQSSPTFDTFILLANPYATKATVTLTFLRQGASPVLTTREVGPTSRSNFWAAELPAQLNGQSFSTVVTSNIPIIAERAMYFGTPLFNGGHESAGVAAPATRWFHAEGRTGPFFDTYILIGNPGTTPANVTVRFLRANDTPITTSLTVAAKSRGTIYVDGVPGLPDTDVSTEVTSDVPVISERAMYWPGGYDTWYEAHNSFGVTSTGVAWGLAEGRFGFAQKFETYILLANPTSTSTRVRVTFLRQGNRAPIVSEQILGANARANVDMTALLTATDYDEAGERFGAIVESLDNVGIAVERAMYFTTSATQFWNGGTNATAVKLR